MSIQFLARLGAFKTRLSGSFGKRRGASGIEYGMLVGLIAVAVLAGVASSGNSISALFVAVCNKLNTVSGGGGTCAGSGTGSGGTGGSGPVAVNGACGADNGISVASTPAGAAACATGTVAGMSGTGPWSWTCAGSNGGSSSGTCTASINSCAGLAAGSPCTMTESGTAQPVIVVTTNLIYAWPSDQTATWNDGTTNWVRVLSDATTSGSTAVSYMNGQSDTSTLVGLTVPVSGGLYQAATLCRAHGPDWYLPAEGELVAMLGENGTGSLSFNSTGSYPAGYYWSASEYR